MKTLSVLGMGLRYPFLLFVGRTGSSLKGEGALMILPLNSDAGDVWVYSDLVVVGQLSCIADLPGWTLMWLIDTSVVLGTDLFDLRNIVSRLGCLGTSC
ncbi:hypothetical protein Nepgr_021438 [Nepenthes gracilis]|uniref:Uncharacterized protein n=1 Tax=Nepenthes gracilis TaxID=150966 RepID=A0AAD3SYS9_NEPGR|nr:hypothetical protein Nepgr_021438 [Nepenthes gracilis]